MQVTFDLPDDVVAQLHPLEDKLPQVLELGLRELNAIAQFGFSGVAEVLEFLASLPTPEDIIVLRPSETLQAQIIQVFLQLVLVSALLMIFVVRSPVFQNIEKRLK